MYLSRYTHNIHTQTKGITTTQRCVCFRCLFFDGKTHGEPLFNTLMLWKMQKEVPSAIVSLPIPSLFFGLASHSGTAQRKVVTDKGLCCRAIF